MVKDMVDMEVEDLNVVDMDMVDISKSRTFLAQFGLVFFIFKAFSYLSL